MKNLLLIVFFALLTLGPALAQVRAVPAFHAIQLGGGVALELTAGGPQRVEVSVLPAEYANDLKTTVENGVLLVRFEHPNGNVRTEQLRVAVTADQLTAITASSGSIVKTQGQFAAPKFALTASSGSNVRADLTTRDLLVRLSGGSVATLTGQTDRLNLDASGGSIFTGPDLKTNACRAEASGGSIVRLAAGESLAMTASGGSNIKYHGAPHQLVQHISGGSTIKGM